MPSFLILSTLVVTSLVAGAARADLRVQSGAPINETAAHDEPTANERDGEAERSTLEGRDPAISPVQPIEVGTAEANVGGTFAVPIAAAAGLAGSAVVSAGALAAGILVASAFLFSAPDGSALQQLTGFLPVVATVGPLVLAVSTTSISGALAAFWFGRWFEAALVLAGGLVAPIAAVALVVPPMFLAAQASDLLSYREQGDNSSGPFALISAALVLSCGVVVAASPLVSVATMSQIAVALDLLNAGSAPAAQGVE